MAGSSDRQMLKRAFGALKNVHAHNGCKCRPSKGDARYPCVLRQIIDQIDEHLREPAP